MVPGFSVSRSGLSRFYAWIRVLAWPCPIHPDRRRRLSRRRMQGLLIIIVKQHGNNRQFIFRIAPGSSPAAQTFSNALIEYYHDCANGLQSAVMRSATTLSSSSLPWQRTFLHLDIVVTGNTLQLELFHFRNQRNDHTA